MWTLVKSPYAKQNLGTESSNCGTKRLGLEWDKTADTISIAFPELDTILGKLACIYDSIGLVSPIIRQGKVIFRDACEQQVAWDAPLSDELAAKWKRRDNFLPGKVVTKRTLAPYQEPINEVELHPFGDASGHGVAAAVDAVVHQDFGITQGLVAAKARLAKQRIAEIESQKVWWIERTQARCLNSPKFADDKLQLNLQPNNEEILECRGRIQGNYPVFLPNDAVFTAKFVQKYSPTYPS